MRANHMLLPRGGYDFVQVSTTEYHWIDEKKNLSALVMAPEGTRNGWHYFVKSASPAWDCSGRKSSLDAAFRKAAHALDLVSGKRALQLGAKKARTYRFRAVRRLFDDPPVAKMARLLSDLKTQNG